MWSSLGTDSSDVLIQCLLKMSGSSPNKKRTHVIDSLATKTSAPEKKNACKLQYNIYKWIQNMQTLGKGFSLCCCGSKPWTLLYLRRKNQVQIYSALKTWFGVSAVSFRIRWLVHGANRDSVTYSGVMQPKQSSYEIDFLLIDWQHDLQYVKGIHTM